MFIEGLSAGAPDRWALRVLHAGAHLLVVDKPAGMLSVPGRGDERQDCASARVQRDHADALVVHRLDMATSGLLLFARGVQAQALLSRAFREREVHKRYVAVVQGLLEHDELTIDLPLIPDWPNRPRSIVDHARGKPSLTHVRVLGRDAASGTTRVELQPVTGRSHQLRVHMQALGHPILGDALYAPDAVRERARRLLLHASTLVLHEPITGERLRFDSPPAF